MICCPDFLDFISSQIFVWNIAYSLCIWSFSYFYLQILFVFWLLELISCQILICIVLCKFKAFMILWFAVLTFWILFPVRSLFEILHIFYAAPDQYASLVHLVAIILCLLYGFLNPSVHFSVPALNLLLRLSGLFLLWLFLAHCWIILYISDMFT